MEKFMQRLIESILVFLLLGSAAGCQGNLAERSEAKEEEIPSQVVRVLGTKPVDLELALVVFFESSSEDTKCTELRMTGRRVPITARQGIWPESLPLSFPKLEEQHVDRVPLDTSQNRSNCKIRSSEERECYEFSGSIEWKGKPGCSFRPTSLSVPIFEDGGYVGGVAFSLKPREGRSLEIYKGEVSIECERGERNEESGSRDLQCTVPNDAFRGYKIIEGDSSNTTLEINIYKNN